MPKLLTSILFLFFIVPIWAQQITNAQYKQDFDYFYSTIKSDYCYWDKKETDWNRVKNIYASRADTITTRYNFVMLIETMFHELYDHHASLSTNTNESSKLVPSGTDVWAEYVNGKPIITEVRLQSGAYKAGIQPGMQVIMINDIAVETAIKPFIGKSLKTVTTEAKNYALRVALAGIHSKKRVFKLSGKDGVKEFYPDDFESVKYSSPVETNIINGFGYIRINNDLGDIDMIPLFDSAVDALMNTKAMILDLRETPSGGNTTVVRAIMSRFISKPGAYQQHELTAEERETGIKRSWIEIVSPRKKTYTKPLVVLVDHWTGSVSEGLTIGFDALKRATIIGTPMAGLMGAVYSYKMPNTGIGFNFPVEKLFHVNGTPREQFKPTINIIPASDKDAIMNAALQFLSEKFIKK